jgi:hypothetical protein
MDIRITHNFSLKKHFCYHKKKLIEKTKIL